MKRCRPWQWIRALTVVMAVVALSAVAPAGAGDEPQAPTGGIVTPAEEERAIEHWNKWINAPGPDDPSKADQREGALELPGDADSESDLDRFEGFE
jgi:hypothetical protein